MGRSQPAMRVAIAFAVAIVACAAIMEDDGVTAEGGEDCNPDQVAQAVDLLCSQHGQGTCDTLKKQGLHLCPLARLDHLAAKLKSKAADMSPHVRSELDNFAAEMEINDLGESMESDGDTFTCESATQKIQEVCKDSHTISSTRITTSAPATTAPAGNVSTPAAAPPAPANITA